MAYLEEPITRILDSLSLDSRLQRMNAVPYPVLETISQTRAVGDPEASIAAARREFNDVVQIGLFPDDQKIKRVQTIDVWAGDRVTGIKVTYILIDDTTRSVLHGRDTEQHAGSFGLNENQYLQGAFGRRDQEGGVGSIGFVVLEADNGRVVIQGPYGNPPQPGRMYGTFGNIAALAGSDENSHGICSLSFVKSDKHDRVLL